MIQNKWNCYELRKSVENKSERNINKKILRGKVAQVAFVAFIEIDLYKYELGFNYLNFLSAKLMSVNWIEYAPIEVDIWARKF